MGEIGEVLFGSSQAGMFGCGDTRKSVPYTGGNVATVKKAEKAEKTPPAPVAVAEVASLNPVPLPAVALTAAPSDALITWTPTLVQEMNGPDNANWQTANWSNGNPFDCTWQPDNVTFREGIMILTLDNKGCPKSCDGKPYASGEYRTTREAYGYGYYEARMKAASGSGLVAGTFFTYTGTWGQSSHHEIDFEFLGKDPECKTLQLNYYAAGTGKSGEHEKMIKLGFNACEGFHNYGFKWTPEELVYYVDGQVIHAATKDIPSKPGKIMANIWPGTGVEGWLGQFKYPGKPIQVNYDWIKYSTLEAAGQPTPAQPAVEKPAAEIPPSPAAAAVNSLSIKDIAQGSFDFNGGSVASSGGVYKFSAKSKRDPGFGIPTGDKDIKGRETVKFEIKGSLKKEGGYARFIAQVYDDGDDDSIPSVSLDPVALSGDFQPMTINLEGRVDRAKKVQFLLVTDKGSCTVEIRNIRFE